MGFTYDSSISVLFDLLRAVTVLYNKIDSSKVTHEPVLAKTSSVESALSRIWEGIDDNTPGLALFYTYNDDTLSFICSRYEPEILDSQSAENFLIRFEKENKTDLYINLLSYYSSVTHTDDFFKNLIKDDHKLLTYINRLKIADRIKLELIEFHVNPDAIMEPMLDFLKRMRRRINRAYRENKTDISVFTKELSVQARNEGNRLLHNVNRCLGSDYKEDSKLFLTHSYLNEHMVESIVCGTSVLIVLGINSFIALNRGTHRDNILNTEQFFKAIADKTRIRMMLYLTNKDMYVGELAAKCRLSDSTASYHLDILLAARIVSSNTVNKRMYYSLNKKEVQEKFGFYMNLLN